MTVDFKEYFDLKHECADTIAAQLEEGLRKYIAKLKAGQRLPTERELTDTLNVGRNTLRRALDNLTEEKLLVRVRRKGTFVAPSMQEKVAAQPGMTVQEDVNPMAWHGFDHVASPPPKVAELTLALFENMPEQKKVWEEIVDIFNRSSREEKLKIDWLPANLDFSHNPDRLKDYYLKRGYFPDIVQCSMDYRFKELMQKLPEMIPASLQKDIYLTHNLKPSCQDLLNYIVPVYTAIPLCVWNRQLAKKYKITNVEKMISDNRLPELLHSAGQALPEDITVGGVIPNFFRFYGHPGAEQIDLDFFKHLFSKAEKCFKDSPVELRERIFGLYFKDYNLNDRFFTDRNFMHFNLGLSVRKYPHDMLKQDCAINVYLSEKELHQSFSALGIYNESSNSLAAAKFISFLFSRKCQSLFAARLLALPVRWQCVSVIKDEFPEFSVETAAKLREHIVIDDRTNILNMLYQVDFISYGMAEVFDEFVQQALPVDAAAQKTHELWIAFKDKYMV